MMMNAVIVVSTPLGTKKVYMEEITGHGIDEGGNLFVDIKGGRAYFAAKKWHECYVGEACNNQTKQTPIYG